jgi:thiol-disulfide isomerase/thioredoxin
MLKKAFIVIGSLALLLVAAGYIMYVRNPAPVVPAISAADAASSGKPYVVKIHAQWCAVCMVTKDVWSQIQDAYANRVNLLVFDVTNEATTDASRAEARRLGLEQFFDEYSGGTGTIVVLDGRTRAVTASISGSRDFAEYRAVVDATLGGAGR